MVQFQISDRTWLWVGDLNQSEQNQLVNLKQLPGQTEAEALQVLWWSGKALTPYLLTALNPKVAIAASENLDEETVAILTKANTRIYSTEKDGALRWTPDIGFVEAIEDIDRSDSLL